MKPINIGLSDEQRRASVDILNRALSDAYLLVIKTKKFHWDVVGPQFMTLHKLWDKQYEALSDAVDEIAERVRALGSYPVGTATGFLQLASIKEHPGVISSATESVEALVEDHEIIIRNLRTAVDKLTDDVRDQGTADFLTGLMTKHEEMAWMLRSFLEGEQLQASGARPPQAGKVSKVA